MDEKPIKLEVKAVGDLTMKVIELNTENHLLKQTLASKDAEILRLRRVVLAAQRLVNVSRNAGIERPYPELQDALAALDEFEGEKSA